MIRWPSMQMCRLAAVVTLVGTSACGVTQSGYLEPIVVCFDADSGAPYGPSDAGACADAGSAGTDCGQVFGQGSLDGGVCCYEATQCAGRLDAPARATHPRSAIAALERPLPAPDTSALLLATFSPPSACFQDVGLR